MAAPRDAHVQRLRRPGGGAVRGDGPAEVLLSGIAGRGSAAVGRDITRAGWLEPLVLVAALLPLAHLAWRAATDALGADPIRELELETGRWALRMLAITLLITPLRLVTGRGALVKYRRMFGLLTFLYATVHLVVWAGVDWYLDFPAMAEEIAKHRYILVGMLTWLLLLPLAITSTKAWVRRLGGQRWARLHRLVYVAAVTATIHYLWAVKKDTLWPLLYLATFAALLGARLWLRRRPRDGRR